MIAVDTSALVAIIFGEPEAERFDRLVASRPVLIGAPTLLETHQVLGRFLQPGAPDLVGALIARPSVQVVSFDLTHFQAAALAFERFGKGRGHPAQLNFGDCLAYAIAKVHDVPLLFKGDDFGLTDLASADRS